MTDLNRLSIFDPMFNGMGAGEVYRAWAIPELYPNHETAPQALIHNWEESERAIYVRGDYTA